MKKLKRYVIYTIFVKICKKKKHRTGVLSEERECFFLSLYFFTADDMKVFERKRYCFFSAWIWYGITTVWIFFNNECIVTNFYWIESIRIFSESRLYNIFSYIISFVGAWKIEKFWCFSFKSWWSDQKHYIVCILDDILISVKFCISEIDGFFICLFSCWLSQWDISCSIFSR